ncbi:MAG: phosphonate metabolism transcriptional regulator PhnF [Gemmatimonadaceae bacterium]|nr:phosphonate metabolism transcriptional regulator PhnF [Acetobacteraceae bacterium]
MTEAPAIAAASRPAAPLWRQIAQSLSASIGPGGLHPGDRLPTEAQLAAQHGVNRHTVRRAIESLVRTGLVRVEQGRGSFVAEDMIDYAVQPRTRFNEWIRRHNKEPSGQVLHVRPMAASAPVAAGLRIARGAAVALFGRLGLADGVPVSLANHYFALGPRPGLLEALKTEPSVTAALASVGVMDYRRLITRVSARMPTVAEANLLQVPRSRPLLVCENVNVDLQDVVVEFCISHYPSTRVQVMFEP